MGGVVRPGVTVTRFAAAKLGGLSAYDRPRIQGSEAAPRMGSKQLVRGGAEKVLARHPRPPHMRLPDISLLVQALMAYTAEEGFAKLRNTPLFRRSLGLENWLKSNERRRAALEQRTRIVGRGGVLGNGQPVTSQASPQTSVVFPPRDTSAPRRAPKEPVQETPKRMSPAEGIARLQELAKDPSHGDKITAKGLHEAEVGLSLEESGRIPGPIKRDPTGAAEFIDAGGTKWDVKSFNSSFPPRKGGFELNGSISKIEGELVKGENVILDTTCLTPNHTQDLRRAVEARGWSDRIRWYP